MKTVCQLIILHGILEDIIVIKLIYFILVVSTTVNKINFCQKKLHKKISLCIRLGSHKHCTDIYYNVVVELYGYTS